MIFLRLFGPFGVAGAALSLILGILLGIQKMETRHWKKQADQYEQLYNREHAKLTTLVDDYKAAAAAAKASDRANAERVKGLQNQIGQEQKNEYEKRIADARARAERLRHVQPQAGGDPCATGGKAVSGVSAPASGTPETTCKDRLPAPDALTATEQAIQLDELIKWVKRVAGIDVNH
jgi:hypothetical protein